MDRLDLNEIIPGVTRIEGPTKGPLTQEQFDAYLEVFNRRHVNPVHSDVEYCRRRGFRDTLAPGVMAIGFLTEFLSSCLGPRFLQCGNLNVNFIGPMYPGDLITPAGTVREVATTESGRQLTLDVWCQNQHAERVVTGTAEFLIV
jgi:3-hydroxybutyryl-CoA dehydratase